MRITRLALSLVLLAFVPAGSRGQPVPTAKPIGELIADLGSKDFAAREAACAGLLMQGREALPAVRQALKNPNPEVNRRVRQLVDKIELRLAMEPKRVTLKRGTWTLADAVAAIRKQTGYELTIAKQVAPLAEREIALNDVPFWEAVEQLSKAWGHGIHAQRFVDGIQFTDERAHGPFVATDGAFRLQLLKIHQDRDIDFAGRGANQGPGVRERKTTFTFEVLAEPRFIILDIEPVQWVKAVDDRGDNLVPVVVEKKTPDEDEPLTVRKMLRQDYQAAQHTVMRRVSDKATTVTTLTGFVPISVVIGKKKVVALENVLGSKGKEFKVGTDTLRVNRAELDNDTGFYLDIGIPTPRKGMGYGQWDQRIVVTDEKGKPMERGGGGSGNSGGEHHMSQHYRAPKPGDPQPKKLIVEEWKIVTRHVPFSFVKVPLP